MLSKSDAEFMTKAAQDHLFHFTALLLRLHDGQAWRALDYQSWTAYCADKFDESIRTIQRHIRQERIRESVGHDILSRFTGEAIEALLDPDPAHMAAIADIAVRTEDGRIGADVVRAVQAANAEMLVTGAVEGANGEQYRIGDVMVAGVQEYQREGMLSKREYIVANELAAVITRTVWKGHVTLSLTMSESAVQKLDETEEFHISIWREPA